MLQVASVNSAFVFIGVNTFVFSTIRKWSLTVLTPLNLDMWKADSRVVPYNCTHTVFFLLVIIYRYYPSYYKFGVQFSET